MCEPHLHRTRVETERLRVRVAALEKDLVDAKAREAAWAKVGVEGLKEVTEKNMRIKALELDSLRTRNMLDLKDDLLAIKDRMLEDLRLQMQYKDAMIRLKDSKIELMQK